MLTVQKHTHPVTKRPRIYPFDALQVGGKFVVNDPFQFQSVRTMASRNSKNGKGFSCQQVGRTLIVLRFS
jgi:hypothetical protein